MLSMFISSCIAQTLFDTPEKMFERHVLDSDGQVSDIHYYKDQSAMHGPLFFRFSVSNSDMILHEIINKHGLKKVTSVPDEILAINHLASENVDWWRTLDELKKLPTYSISYVPRSGVGDFHIRCLFVEKDLMYFVTTGFFSTDMYIKAR